MTLLPPNATDLERAVDGVTERVDAIPVPLSTLWDPWRCPVELLPWLAYSASVDVWSSAWPEATKRAVIAASFEVHRRKGTVGAVKRAIRALSLRADLTEWHQTDDMPAHTFGVDVLAAASIGAGAVLDGPGQADLIRTLDATKPVRSHYALRVGAEHGTTLQLAAGTAPTQHCDKRLAPTGGCGTALHLAAGGHAVAVVAQHCDTPSGCGTTLHLAAGGHAVAVTLATLTVS